MEIYLGNPGEKLTAWCKANYGPTTAIQWGKGKFIVIYKTPDGQDNTKTLNWDATNNVYGENVPYNGNFGVCKSEDGIVTLLLQKTTCECP